MATSVFFNNFTSSMEQNLIENLIIESIKIYGHDVYYIPRELQNLDEIYGEDSISEYNKSFFVDMYIKDVSGFQGEGDFLSKFNLQIRDQITFTIARRTFFDEIGNVDDLARPQEGDLIYLPLTAAQDNLYEIKFVANDDMMFQQGDYYTFRLDCELFKYSMETINTGFSKIDDMEQEFTKTETTVKDGTYIVDNKKPNDNFIIESSASDIIDFTEKDPFSQGNY